MEAARTTMMFQTRNSPSAESNERSKIIQCCCAMSASLSVVFVFRPIKVRRSDRHSQELAGDCYFSVMLFEFLDILIRVE